MMDKEKGGRRAKHIRTHTHAPLTNFRVSSCVCFFVFVLFCLFVVAVFVFFVVVIVDVIIIIIIFNF